MKIFQTIWSPHRESVVLGTSQSGRFEMEEGIDERFET